MKIRILKKVAGMEVGTEKNARDVLAKTLISRGVAEEVKEEAKEETPKKEVKEEIETKENKKVSRRRTKSKK